MKFLVLSGNPKEDGLCAGLEQALLSGAQAAGAETELLRLPKLSACRVCGDGWGICREEHKCVIQDDGFNELSDKIAEFDALAIVTPVYWAEVSETMKAFFDRFRRCNFFSGRLAGKTAIIAASPGGTGNGLVTALQQIERFCQHNGVVVFDIIGQNRWSAPYKQAAAFEAAKSLCSGTECWRP
ncbi:MAG: flavodoxin family protein [Oscillospiraceae bacterium]|jgi:multimeric flavodoxin WrbA|nr:flavodoxin family protein [Oscillospiraceae bacterium]